MVEENDSDQLVKPGDRVGISLSPALLYGSEIPPRKARFLPRKLVQSHSL